MTMFRPENLEDALTLRAEREVLPLAGGTDVFPARAVDEAWGRPAALPLLDLSGLCELRGIAEAEGGYRLGGLATWSDIVRADLPAGFDGLKQAAREVGGHQIQNRGTLVGNLCNASPAADGLPMLLLLEAEIELASRRGTRRLPLEDFVTGNRQTRLAPDELAVALHIPHPPGGVASRFLKLGSRHYLVISIAAVAGLVALDGSGAIASARIAVGACSPVARRLTALEAALVGRHIDDGLMSLVEETVSPALSPIDDARGSADYRREAACVLVRRLLMEAHRGRVAA